MEDHLASCSALTIFNRKSHPILSGIQTLPQGGQ
jgi:hypothetical protein